MRTDNNFIDDINKRFHAYFVWLCLFSLMIGIINLIGVMKEGRFFGDFVANSWRDVFFVGGLLNGIAFWVAVGLTFNALRSAVIASALGIAITIISKINSYVELFNIAYLFSCIPFLVFGILYFKNLKSIYLIFIPLAVIGISIATDARPLLRLIDALTDISLFMKIRSGESSYYEADPLRPFLISFITPLTYLLTFYFLSVLNNNSKNFFTLTDCTTLKLKSIRDYSLVYWIYRILFFVVAIGVFSFVANQYTSSQYRENEISPLYIAMALSCYILGVYICVSIYRNYIASYFYYYNKPLSWNYLFLNIPVVNIFAWLMSLKNNVDHHSENPSSNTGIKILLIVIFSLSYIVAIINQPAPKTLVIIEFMFGFILLLAYLQFKFGIYFLLAFFAIVVFISTIGFYYNDYNAPSLQFIFTLLIVYPAFHGQIFHFKYKSDSQEIYKNQAIMDFSLMENTNGRFNRYFLAICIFSFIYGVIFSIINIERSSCLDVGAWLYLIFSLLDELAIWIAIGVTFNAFRSVMIAIVTIILLNILGRVDDCTEAFNLSAKVYTFLEFIPFLVFGVIKFKSLRAIYILLVPAAIIGITTFVYSSLSIHIPNHLIPIMVSFITPLSYLLMFYFVSVLQQNTNNKITFANCNAVRLDSRKDYPVIYWLYPIMLFVAISGILLFIVHLYRVLQ